MWLIDVHTRKLEYFEGSNIPDYAILSHRWEDEEVTFYEMQNGLGRDKKGYRKIDGCCRQAMAERSWYAKLLLPRVVAAHHGLQFVWVDTCCIDKSSSAELTEAINSMYRWYEDAAICYAYMSDVSDDSGNFTNSLWFTRGWTLQEMLASVEVRFFGRAWQYLGQRRDDDISSAISSKCNIPSKALQSFKQGCFPAATILSWAAPRTTTRDEDSAYSLLGLLDVNMPLIYGEGKKAFQRLQQEILSSTGDLTIFAWNKSITESRRYFGLPNIFAESLKCFSHGRANIEAQTMNESSFLNCKNSTYLTKAPSGPILTSDGLSLELLLVPLHSGAYIAPVCRIDGEIKGMVLQQMQEGVFIRNCDTEGQCLFNVPLDSRVSTTNERVVLPSHRRHVLLTTGSKTENAYWFLHQWNAGSIEIHYTLPGKYTLFSPHPMSDQKFVLDAAFPPCGVAGMVRRRTAATTDFFVLGFDFDFRVFCLIVRAGTGTRLPSDVVISLSRIGVRDLVLSSRTDMLRLVEAVQAQDDQVWSLDNDGIELYNVTWNQLRLTTSTSPAIRTCSVGSLAFWVDPNDPQYHVEIAGASLIDQSIAPSGNNDLWYHSKPVRFVP